AGGQRNGAGGGGRGRGTDARGPGAAGDGRCSAGGGRRRGSVRRPGTPRRRVGLRGDRRGHAPAGRDRAGAPAPGGEPLRAHPLHLGIHRRLPGGGRRRPDAPPRRVPAEALHSRVAGLPSPPAAGRGSAGAGVDGTGVTTAPSTAIRAPVGAALSCKGWHQEAALRMLMNNLDPAVAERPEELIVYGGAGKAARNWACYEAMVATLRRLENDQTLLVQSGKPVGVFRTHPEAPRVR